MHPSPSRPSFTLTPTTRTLHVRMVCPRPVTFGCSGTQVDFEVLNGPLRVFYTSPSGRGGYFILPGKSLNLPLHLTPHQSSADAIKYLRAGAHTYFNWDYQPKDPTGQRPDRHLSNLKVRIGRDVAPGCSTEDALLGATEITIRAPGRDVAQLSSRAPPT